jgi:hypothetical protein
MKTMRADKKGEKERKEKGKEKISDKKDRARTMFHKIMGNLEKMQAIGGIISYFFPYYFNCRAKKSTKIRLGEKYLIFFPPVSLFFPH